MSSIGKMGTSLGGNPGGGGYPASNVPASPYPILGDAASQSGTHNVAKCAQAAAQIRADQNILPAYQARGQGAMIEAGIQANTAWLNANCH